MGDIPTKSRLLTLYRIFSEETDEEHELSLKDIQQKLQVTFDTDAEVKRDIIREDLRELNDTVLPITVNTGEHGKKFYSHQDRLFELSELRMLMDAVISARFLTEKEAMNLIKKIKRLTSKPSAKKLPHEFFLEGTVKSESMYLKYDIDSLHRAVSENKKISFQYGKYNMDKTFSWHREGERYYVKPYALIWNNDFYYLIGEYEKYEEIRHYRVDRMRNVEVLEYESFKQKPFNLADYMKKTFNMYAGSEEQRIELEMNRELFNVMIDHFGLDVDIRPIDDETFRLKTSAPITDGLIRWLLTWGSDAKVLAPDILIEIMKDQSEKMYRLYHG